jgi:histidine ammonia-lyase
MGTIAARDCLRVLDLTEQVLAAMLITARQGLALRRRVEPTLVLSPALSAFESQLADRVPLVVEDRALDRDLQALLQARHDAVWNP